MKKILSIVLALVLVLSLSTAALAADGDTTVEKPTLEEVQDKQPVVSKTYKVNNGTSPAEEFTFNFEGVSYKNGDGQLVQNASIPAIGSVKISFDALTANLTQTVEANINANDYALGVYTYRVTEDKTNANTAGVTYSDETLYLVLTILRDENSGKHYVAAMHYQDAESTDKSTGFTNEYDSGSLTVSKLIAGNMADMNKKFTFTITLTAPEGTEIKSDITSTATSGTWSDDKLTYTIELGHNESVTLSNIPAGTTYTVTEDAENYTSNNGVYSDEAPTKTISANDTDTVTFTNTLTNEIDMGVSVDSLPYILMLAVACIGLVVFFTKKRAAREN